MATRWGRVLGILSTLVVVELAAGGARPARACLNGVSTEMDDDVRLVRAAERDLARGAPRAALRRLAGGPHVACAKPESATSTKTCKIADGHRSDIVDRALRRRWALATAVATLRTDPGAAERAAQHLLYLQQQSGESPYIEARLAEALAHVAGAEPRALQLLADLEQRDLMPDAGGYALLARLRRARGDASGADRALARCRKIADKPDACPVT
jgi:predicted Zn-dependent protease